MQAIPTSAAEQPASISQLFSYPFRIFFLSMSLLGLVVIPIWV
ncbi:MAG: NnrS family protein, partial [Gammaproteobacteria bacterium]